MDAESMLPRVIKFLISLAFYAVSESWTRVRELAGKTMPPRIVVIYYHHVLDEHRERFKRQLDHLTRWTKPIRADSNETFVAGSRYAALTVDDGWLSFANNGIPELERRNIPVTMFAISDRLGSKIDDIAFDRLVAPDELRGLNPTLVTIGSHTATHARMTTLNEQEALRELRDSREKLSKILDREVKTFCFPYGAYDEKLIPACREAGYDRVFTCTPEFANPGQFVVGRMRVDPTDWPLEFHLKLMGAYRWLPLGISLKRRILGIVRGQSRGSTESISDPS
jgi:peptidoglycan/xylan/chitin deacetylase (PgdA/CDA1 family)